MAAARVTSAQECQGVFVVAGGDAAPVFEAVEAAFDAVAVPVARRIKSRRAAAVWTLGFAAHDLVGPFRNGVCDAVSSQVGAGRIVGVGLVGQQANPAGAVVSVAHQQWLQLRVVTGLTGGQRHYQRRATGAVAEAQARAEAMQSERDLIFIHPYDDPRIIAGQGTIAVEMLADRSDLDALVIPIGGGGLIAGNAIAANRSATASRSSASNPALSLDVECLERGGSPLRRGHTRRRHRGEECRQAGVAGDPGKSFRHRAGFGIATRTCGERLPDLAEDDGGGRGRGGSRGDAERAERFAGKKVGLILCGGNIDPRILASIMVRELERGEQVVSFRLTIPDRPGILGQIASRIGALGANILEVDHKRLFLDVPAKGARLDVTVETRDRAHAEEIIAALGADGYSPVRINASDVRG